MDFECIEAWLALPEFRVTGQVVAPHLTVVKLTCNKNGVQTYSSWHASTQSQEDHHGPHNHILP
jgi:hypothetical protein